MLTTAGSRLATAQINNGLMYFQNGWGSIAPVLDPPQPYRKADSSFCLDMLLKSGESTEEDAWSLPSGGRRDIVIRHQNPQFCNNKQACPKKLMEVWRSFVPARPADPSSSFVLFLFLVHVKGRGGWVWVEEREQVEREREGITICNRRRKVTRGRIGAMLMFCCAHMFASPR